MATEYYYELKEEHLNQIGDVDLPCDGTVKISGQERVCYAVIKWTMKGVQYTQRIMNVPFTNEAKMKKYFVYFVKDQERQNGC